MKPPLGRRILRRLISATDAAREENRRVAARAVRAGVVGGVHALRRLRGIEFPARATGGWWWVWRWKLEFLLEWFEWESVHWARRLIRPGMTVFDLGAHVGYYSRIFSRWVGPRGRVFAFEASPENVAMLRGNLSSPRFANVEVVSEAVSDRKGTIDLFVSPGHSNHSLIQGFTEAERVVRIATTSLDAFTAERAIDAVDFVKMDIEGAETMAFDGMRETVRRSPRFALLVECNLLSLETLGSSPEKFVARIEELGLVPRAILPDATLGALPDPSEIDLYVNLLCVKPGDIRLGRGQAPPLRP